MQKPSLARQPQSLGAAASARRELPRAGSEAAASAQGELPRAGSDSFSVDSILEHIFTSYDDDDDGADDNDPLGSATDRGVGGSLGTLHTDVQSS